MVQDKPRNGHKPGVSAYYGILGIRQRKAHGKIPYEDDLFEAIGLQQLSPKKTIYKANLRKDLIADRDYVEASIGKAAFVDVREPVLYSGETKQAFVERAGHLPGSINLPASEAFTKSGNFKPLSELTIIAEKTVGTDQSKPFISYCDTGNVARHGHSFLEMPQVIQDPALPITRNVNSYLQPAP
jgi:3-mercaptopyruvate sulfurtransferase SseA